LVVATLSRRPAPQAITFLFCRLVSESPCLRGELLLIETCILNTGINSKLKGEFVLDLIELRRSRCGDGCAGSRHRFRLEAREGKARVRAGLLRAIRARAGDDQQTALSDRWTISVHGVDDDRAL